MNLEATLDDLGLQKTKGKVYLAALQVGVGSAQDIAKKAGVPRTTAHEILQQLTQKGLVSVTLKGRKHLYVAEKPTTLERLLKEKEKKLAVALPQLLALYTTMSARPTVRVYEGVAGVKNVFEDTLTVSNKKLYGILSMEDLYEVPGEKYMGDYVERRVDAGIQLCVIRSAQTEVEEVWPSSRAELRELRYANGDLLFPMTVYMYDNKVSLMGTGKESFGMIIESTGLYQTMKNLFDVLWQVSRPGKRLD